jgi:hypothetical protein
MRIWYSTDFISWHCARCGQTGGGRERGAPADPAKAQRVRAEMAERADMAAARQLAKAQWLWQQRHPPRPSLVETYLRDARGFNGPLPATLGFLPSRGEYPPAMIAGFGLAIEQEPGIIAVDGRALVGVHLTRLLPDGSDRERGDQAKIMIARSLGWPIVLAPANDLLGLAITEGIEDALSVHVATGLGTWAAASASRLPALAKRVPPYIDCVTVYAHDDCGKRYALQLADVLTSRGNEVFVEGLAR